MVYISNQNMLTFLIMKMKIKYPFSINPDQDEYILILFIKNAYPYAAGFLG